MFSEFFTKYEDNSWILNYQTHLSLEFVVPLTFVLHFQYMKTPTPTATITIVIAAPTDRATVGNLKP